MIYIAEDEFRALSQALDLAGELRAAFLSRAAGRIVMPAKTNIKLEGLESFFHAMPVADRGGEFAGIKWVAGAAGNQARGLPHIGGLFVLNDIRSGRVLALMDAAPLTAVRTAAVSLLAAGLLADPQSSAIAFIGTGVQAESHLALFRERFPLREARLFGRSPESVRRFAGFVREHDIVPLFAEEPRSALEAADIIISTVPASAGLTPFLECRWLKPGAFASMVDLGRSWTRAALADFDRLHTDDRQQSDELVRQSQLPAERAFDGDLGSLLAGPVERHRDHRTGFLFPGTALADLAIAAAVYREALRLGRGQMLTG